MISTIFHAVFYNPIYNALVTLVAWIPGGDVGLAIIVLTLLIRAALLPFSLSVARHQRLMRTHEGALNEIRELHKDDKVLQNTKTFEFYKEKNINPFSPILLVFIQLPILLALYWVFREPFTALDTARLYSFTPLPVTVSAVFLGLVSMGSKSIVLAVLAGATQYLQATLSLGSQKPQGQGMQADFTRALSVQMRYVFPILIGTIAYSTGAAIALYFLTTNIAGALQEWYVNRQFKTPPQSS